MQAPLNREYEFVCNRYDSLFRFVTVTWFYQRFFSAPGSNPVLFCMRNACEYLLLLDGNEIGGKRYNRI